MDANANDLQISQKRSKAVANEPADGTELGVESLAPPKLFADPSPVPETLQLKEEIESPTEEKAEPIYASPEPKVANASPVDLAPVVPVAKPLQLKEEGKEETEVQEVQLKSFADAPSELPNDDEADSSGGDPPANPSKNTKNFTSSTSETAQKQEGGPSTSSGNSNAGISNDVMGKMETTIGHDFSNVNIHTDSSKASEVGALAYTQGTDIHFAPGQFNPSSSSGQELLGHELTHVKQQAQGRVQPTTQASNGMAVNDDKGLEAEADAFGAKAASSSAPVQKKEDKNSTLPNTNGPIQKKEDVSQLDEDEAPAEVPNDAIFRRGSTTIINEDDNYNISGKYRDIVRQLAADGEDGSISTSFDDIVTSSNGGSNARVDLTVKIVKRMPVWTDLPQVQALANDEDEPQRAYYQNIVNAWNEFYGALDAHEEGHKAIDVAHFSNCHRSLIGKKMGELDAQLTAIEDAAAALHSTFHEEHGAQETIRDVQRPYEVTADESDDDEDSVQYKVDPNVSKSNDLDVPSKSAPIQRKENSNDGVENSTSNQEYSPFRIDQSPSSSNDGVAQGFFPLIALGAAAFGVGFGVGYTAGTAASSRHTDRNQNNQLPTGILRKQSDGSSGSYIYDQGGDNNYVDAAERVWVLMSEGESVYHQPKEIVDGAIDHQWQRLQAWWNNQDMASLPNKKFISRDDQGGSFEAVLQPNEDGSYTTNWLNSGTQQGTYNYSSPESLGGKIGHFVDDVLPHYLNEDYSATPTQQKSDRTIQRKEDAESPLMLETTRSNETVQLDAGDGDTTTSLALNFPFDIAAARTNARAAWSFLQLQGLFDSLKREIDGSEHYSGDTSDLADASSQMTGTIRTFASREQDGILQNGEIFLLQPFINGFEDTYNTSFRGFRSSVISNINSSRNSREFEPMTAEMAEAKRQAYENGDDDQLERLQSLTDSIKDYNEKVSNYIGYASRVSSRVRSSATLQAISSATGNIAEYAGKAGQIVTAMHIVADFATDSSNSELHTSINRVQRGLDGINLGMSFVTAVPVLGFLWEHYYYPAATFCLTKIGEIASRRNRDRRLLTWIGNNWRSSRPPAIDATMEVAFPGGQPVFSFLWHLFFGNYHYNSTAEEYFMSHETDINAGVPNNMRVTGKWNPLVDNHISGFQYWADRNKMDLWLMFYGADLPFPGTGSVEQSLGDYNDDVSQRATSPVSKDHSPVDGSGIIQKMEASFGTSFSDVKIHENSSKATDAGALAFAQGSDVHFAPGQFKPDTKAGQELIGHELTHVVQQRQGRVKPTTQHKGMEVNDDPALEKEADDGGKKFVQNYASQLEPDDALRKNPSSYSSSSVIQNKVNPIQMIGGYDSMTPPTITPADHARVNARMAARNRENMAEAIRTGDIGSIRAITDFSSATPAQRMVFIDKILEQWWISPWDESALERIWNSFGENIAEIGSRQENKARWDECLERGMDPSNIRALTGLREDFRLDVQEKAKDYIRANILYAQDEMVRLGLRNSNEEESPTAEIEQQLRWEETQYLASETQRLLEAQRLLRQVHVGYRRYMTVDRGGSVSSSGVRNALFNPTRRPDYATHPDTDEDPAKTWEDTKVEWDKSVAAINAITSQSPAVYAAFSSGGDNLDNLSEDNPETARETASRLLNELERNGQLTLPKIDSLDLDWKDLVPIHNQLYSGVTRGQSEVDWSNDFNKSVARDVIGDHETREFWIALGLGTASAAAFIVSELATGGAATAFWLGVGIGISGAQAVSSWENWEDLDTANESAASHESQLVEDGQVNAALLQAIVDSVFAFVDVATPAVKGAMALRSASRLESALMTRSAGHILENMGELTARESAEAVQRGIAELGVEETMRKTGKSADELSNIIRSGNLGDEVVESLLQRLRQAEELGLGEAGESTIRTIGSPMETSWATERSIQQALADMSNAIAEGTISRDFASQLTSEAIERLGPAEVLRRCGWDNLVKTLPEGGPAGTRLMEFRESVFTDLQRFVREELEGDVTATGTRGNFSNDLDMSFTGANASSARQQAMEYLARRLGIENSPKALDRVMLMGMFTDPRRIHAYDALPTAMREEVARIQATNQEQLIWNRRVWEAVEHNNDEMAQSLRETMGDLGIPEFNYRPLSGGEVRRLSQRIDSLWGQLETAIESGDQVAQRSLAEEIGNSQALINAAEEGGYFSGGGVRRFVTERPGETPFSRLPGGAEHGIPSAERLTSLIDQLPKLDHSLLKLSGSTEDVIAGVRGIGKYGARLAEVVGEEGVENAAVWRILQENCLELKQAADSGGIARRMTAGEAEIVIRDARRAFQVVTELSDGVIIQLRNGVTVQGVGTLASEIQRTTRNHVFLLRSIDWTIQNLNICARAIRTGVALSDIATGSATDALPIDSADYDDDLVFQEKSRDQQNIINPTQYKLPTTKSSHTSSEIIQQKPAIPSSVEVHTNSSKATEMGALAFAQGSDIHFAPGQFKPDTVGGQELIGHELAHVQQQKNGGVKATTSVNGTPINDDKRLEKEADDFGISFANSLRNNSQSEVRSQSPRQFRLAEKSAPNKINLDNSMDPFNAASKQYASIENTHEDVADFSKENALQLKSSKKENAQEKAFKL